MSHDHYRCGLSGHIGFFLNHGGNADGAVPQDLGNLSQHSGPVSNTHPEVILGFQLRNRSHRLRLRPPHHGWNLLAGGYALTNSNHIRDNGAGSGLSPGTPAVEDQFAHQVTFHLDGIIDAAHLCQKEILRNEDRVDPGLNHSACLFGNGQELYLVA